MKTLAIPATLSNERGGAMVEMAISMIVLVPTLLYSFMLDDLLRYKLDQQEAVVSAVWDLTSRDYEKGTGHAASVQNANRLLYCDHSAAYNAYNQSKDCNDTAHHQALAAHQCWLPAGKENQVSCTRVNDTLLMDYPDFGVGPSSSLIGKIKNGSQGGFYRCKARLSVVNEMITNQFMQQFSDKKMIEDGIGTGGGGSGGKGLAAVHHSGGDVHNIHDGYFLFPPDQTAILTDTWALNEVKDQDPNSESGVFYDRVEAGYTGGLPYLAFLARGMIFLGKAWSKQLLTPGYGLLLGDNLFKADLSVRHGQLKQRFGVGTGTSSQTPKVGISEEGSNRKYYATPWKDWEDNNYEKTYKDSKRGKYYMGCKDPESC